MIFVTTGSSELGFDSLIKTCDEIAKNSPYDIFCQIGGGTYIPQSMEWTRYLAHSEMLATMAKAELVISHAGFGIISESLRARKRLIVIPREIESGNAFHGQSSIADYLQTEGFLLCEKKLTNLTSTIEKALAHEFRPYELTSNIPDIILNYITNLKK